MVANLKNEESCTTISDRVAQTVDLLLMKTPVNILVFMTYEKV